MATTSVNNIVKTLGHELRHKSYPLDSTGANDFNQGDLLYWSSASKVVKALDVDANAANLAGVALKPAYLALYTTALTGTANKQYAASAEVGLGCVVSLKTTAGETYNHDTAVYIGADAQTITTVAGSNPVGYIQLRNNQAAVTGAAGTNVDVLLNVKDPITSL